MKVHKLIALRIGITLLLSQVFQSGLHSEENNYRTGFSNTGARAFSFAGAYVADAFDASSMYSNPAAIAYLEKRSLLLNHFQEQVLNSTAESIILPFSLHQTEVLSIGLDVQQAGYFGFAPASDFKMIQYGYDIAYGREIIPYLSLGAAIGVRYATSSSSNVWGASSSFGVFYSPSQQISYGVVMNGVGSGILYSFDGASTLIHSENLPKRLQVGIEMRFPEQPEKTYFTIALGNEKIFGTNGLRYQGGIEICPLRYLAVRGGYLVESDLQAPRFGLGLQTDRFRLDYSISPSKVTGRAFIVSCSFSLSRQSGNQ